MTDRPPSTAAERLYAHLCEAYTARDLAAVLRDYDDALAEARATPPSLADIAWLRMALDWEVFRQVPGLFSSGEMRDIRKRLDEMEARATPPSLDAERLTKAIRIVENADPAEWLEHGDQADAIAAEYARLSPHNREADQ